MCTAVGPAQTRVFENEDLLLEILRFTIPDAADVEARYGTDDPVQRPELRARTVMAFRLRRLDKRTKRVVDVHCEAFVRHVHRRCMRFRLATHRYANSGKSNDEAQKTVSIMENFRNVVRQSVWPTLLFNATALQFQSSLDHLFCTRIPSSLRDVYHLAAGDCAVCGWYCKLQLDSVPVWHQPHARPGEYLPFTSHDHFVEVCFMEHAEHLEGRPPAMQLRVDEQFTDTDYDFLDFLHAIRQTPDHDACIKRLFAERRAIPEPREARRNSFIVHLPLFRFKLESKWGVDSSIAEIFGKTDEEMRELIMRGSRSPRSARRTATFRDHVVF